MDSIWASEVAPRVPTRSFGRKAKSPATDCDVCHTSQIVALQGHDCADIRSGSQHFADSPQVAQAFFADVAGEEHVNRRHLASNPKQLSQLDSRGYGDTVVPHTRP